MAPVTPAHPDPYVTARLGLAADLIERAAADVRGERPATAVNLLDSSATARAEDRVAHAIVLLKEALARLVEGAR